MIPLKDDAPRLSTPLLNYFLIAANIVVFLFQSSLGRRAELAFVQTFGLVPGRLTAALQGTLPHLHGHAHTPSLGICVFTDPHKHVSARQFLAHSL